MTKDLKKSYAQLSDNLFECDLSRAEKLLLFDLCQHIGFICATFGNMQELAIKLGRSRTEFSRLINLLKKKNIVKWNDNILYVNPTYIFKGYEKSQNTSQSKYDCL